jgi:hypothetical protein
MGAVGVAYHTTMSAIKFNENFRLDLQHPKLTQRVQGIFPLFNYIFPWLQGRD